MMCILLDRKQRYDLPTALPTAFLPTASCSGWKRLYCLQKLFQPPTNQLPTASNGGKRGFRLVDRKPRYGLARARVKGNLPVKRLLERRSAKVKVDASLGISSSAINHQSGSNGRGKIRLRA